jgi:hypothetical protein
MNTLPTVEEILDQFNAEYFAGEVFGEFAYKRDTVILAMIEFAKLRIQEAVKYTLEKVVNEAKINSTYYDEDDCGREKVRQILASEPYASGRTDGDGDLYGVDVYEIDKQSILNLETSILKELNIAP